MNSSPYHAAGTLLNEHLEKRRGLKSIAFDTHGGGSSKEKGAAAYATVCKTLQHLAIINEVLSHKNLSKAIDVDSVRNKGLLYVMLYELLFGKYKSIRGGGKIKRMIVKHEKQLRREAEVCMANRHAAGGDGNNKRTFPRYIRVNTLYDNLSNVVQELKKYLIANCATKDVDDNKDGSVDYRDMSIYVDAHVPDLLVLPPTSSSWLHSDYELVKRGKVVLQDKSSCFSALVLAHGLGEDKIPQPCDYIDACSAPGNKTSHLAALVFGSIGDDEVTRFKKKRKGNKSNYAPKSTIFACERSSSRFNILKERMKQLVPKSVDGTNSVEVVPIHCDFLKVDPADPKFAHVRAILLDPSCSGSGIVNSPDRWMENDGLETKDTNRIQSLSNFQLVALKHAMSFPNVDRIVYSTCSVYEEENEAVVSGAMSGISDDEDGWQLYAPICMEHWPRRGIEGGVGGLTKNQADCLIRCDGNDGDATNGFFVAFFVRKKLACGPRGTVKAENVYSLSIPIYSAQFSDLCKRMNAESTALSDDYRASDLVPSNSMPKSGAASSCKSIAKSAKKRDKKLAWKRKQTLHKTLRVKKNEACRTYDIVS
jgi:putative methyltransferase